MTLKHDIFGLIWRSFWGIYAHAELRVWILHGEWLSDGTRYYCYFLHFYLANVCQNFGRNMVHDTYGVNKALDPELCKGSDLSLAPDIYVSFRLTWNISMALITYLKLKHDAFGVTWGSFSFIKLGTGH